MAGFVRLGRFFPAVIAGAAAVSCSTSSSAPSPSAPPVNATPPPTSAPAAITLAVETQRPGNAKKGYRSLVNEPYVPCGIPWSAYSMVFSDAPANMRVPGREGRNAKLPYNYTAMTTKAGVELVTANCLTCHASHFDGKVIVGLGASDADFTHDAESQTSLSSQVGLVVRDPKERAEWQKWKQRVDTIAPYSVLSTRGPNPADQFTAVLFAHHDPKTLAWSDTPLIEVPPPHDTPVDVPPWWRMKKKSSMFYVGGGRGDHARIMMTASILCTSSVAESKAIDAFFPDIRAYIENLEAPKYPFAIDHAKAELGKPIFEASCAQCHGTYGGVSGGESTYPNRMIALSEIGTDRTLAMGHEQFAAPFVHWFKDSYFGEIARMEPKQGYVAPPLDGIWATAPFLHNGSVPTIEALLDSTKRPRFWTRSFDSSAASFDQKRIGWKTTTVLHNKASERDDDAKKALYDTTLPGYSNAGHTFGDVLSNDDRDTLIEYLKTL